MSLEKLISNVLFIFNTYAQSIKIISVLLIFFGTWLLAKGLMISKKEAVKLGKHYPTLGSTDDF